MRTGNTILNYYNGLNLKFHELFSEMLKDFDETVIHDFRVNIKKQMAFFHLMDFIDPHFKVAAVKTLFFVIFRKVGAIRKVHIEKNILTNKDLNINVDTELLKNLDDRLIKKVKRFQEHNYEADLKKIIKNSKSVKRKILKVSKNKLNKGLNKYFTNLLQGLNSLAKSCKVNEEDFHELRKLLKELFYNLNFINQALQQEQSATSITSYLDQLQTNLGEWHDIHLTLKHFSALEKSDFDDLISVLKQKNDWYVERIRTQLVEFEMVISSI